MAITTPQGFDNQSQEPLELKTVQTTLTDRNNISLATRYQGLTVYVVNEAKTYRLQGGVTDGHWVEQKVEGYNASDFISTSAGAADAGKPVVLNSEGKIDSTMLSDGDLSLYYLLDGTRALTGDMDADGNSLTNLADGSNAQDAVTVNQLSGYLPVTGTAADSSELGGELPSFYLNASNINAGTIDDAYLPASISSDITGNAATSTVATALETSRTITISGSATSPAVPFDGSADISIPITIPAGAISLESLVAGTGISGSDYDGSTSRTWNLSFAGTGSGTSAARWDHFHDVFGSGSVTNTGAPSSGAINASYTRKISLTNSSLVELQVAVGNSSVSWGLPYNTVLAQIVSSTHRPNATIYANALVANTGSAADYIIPVRIDTNGNVVARSTSTITVPINTYVHFHVTYVRSS